MVSIIVRTKDRPKLLKNALKSIAAQTYRPIEVVLVNDGGCELDVEELKGILGDVSLNYRRLEKNTGRAHAGNVGLEHARGEYIGFLDDDDEFYPEHLKILTAKLKNSTLRIAYTEAEVVFLDLAGEDEMVERFKYVIYSQEFSREMLLIQNYIPLMCFLFDRSVFDEVRFDESFEIFEDWKLLITLSEQYWFEHINMVTARYIQWCDKSQINRRALSENFSQVAYKKVLDQNINKITSSAIYTYCVNSTTERMKLINELIQKESASSTEMKGLVEKLKLIESENRVMRTEKQQIEHEKDRLLDELLGLQHYLRELSNSVSWKLIERYRTFKDKAAPVGSKRRIFYEMLLKSIKVIQQEGVKGLSYRAKRKIQKVRFKIGYLKCKGKLKRIETVNVRREPNIPEVCGFTQKPVHIIMPVYNGYECLRDCVGSIVRNTDLTTHTLVIIDDKSTDERVTAYLQRFKEGLNGRKVEMLFNTDNLGFVKTINKGMKLSPEDVVILNSDTLVTRNWVEKLQRAAYSKLRIATATPLSNYVTINGIPKPFRYNTIPGGMEVEAFSEFVEKISLRYYPEVPAGVGFCMYIKRDILEQLGYFDETRFEKGYAEETDFCMRALKKGFLHVLDDATYIYHVGGVSFESIKDPKILREKNLMIERNLETLKTLHPEYTNLVEKALRDSLDPIHRYINLRIRLLENNDEDTLCNRPKT